MKARSRRFAPILLVAASLSSAVEAGGPPPEICPAIDEPAPSAARGVRAFRDPATGQLRAPTADELRRLSQEGHVREKAARIPVIVTRADGTKIADLGGEFLMRVVAEKQPDGSTRLRCLPPAAAGEK